MSSLQSSLLGPLCTPIHGVRSSSFSIDPPQLSPGVWAFRGNDKRVPFDMRPFRCSAISRSRTQEYADVFQNGLPVIKWQEIVEDDLHGETHEGSISKEIIKRVKSIKSMLGSMDDGEISVSAYDTAWVALVQDVQGTGNPQFPSSLQWIADNQLTDGSWGDGQIFTAHDRLINTLACVVALKSWNMHPEKCEKGMAFFKENICMLEKENPEHMPIGFEVAFPSIVEIALSLGIDVPNDSPVLQEIYARRNLKLTRIPKDIMHVVPTTLLHSLEGMPGLDWEKLLKLQCPDGSFLFSPSSTAYALMQTKDESCLTYLNKAVERFNGGVPNVYPVDMFEHIWAVDRLQRLGISRYFKPEIQECVNYVSRYWTEKGICWARNTRVNDIDDTAMGFRLLRLYGHEVSANVFKHFEKDGEFFAFAGQSNQAVTGMYNLFRASQLMFPGEKILEDAKQFSSKFLREKQATNELLDKWIITKDLPGEVGYALDVPWYANLPRIETRFYIEQYGGEDDVWIGKTLYRMPYVNNNVYLELAKLDFNNCQALHRIEWNSIQKWYIEGGLEEHGVSKRCLLNAYFLAAASIYEPERSRERLAWAKTAILVKAIASYFEQEPSQRCRVFLHDFKNTANARHQINGRRSNKKKTRQELVVSLLGTINHLSLEALVASRRDISPHLRHAWEKWLSAWNENKFQGDAELLVQTITLTSGQYPSEEVVSHPEYKRLSNLTNSICYQLQHYQRHKMYHGNGNGNGSYSKCTEGMTTPEIERDMQEVAQIVLKNSSDGINPDIKWAFLTVARSFYYIAYFDPDTINFHIAKVLLENVD